MDVTELFISTPQNDFVRKNNDNERLQNDDAIEKISFFIKLNLFFPINFISSIILYFYRTNK